MRASSFPLVVLLLLAPLVRAHGDAAQARLAAPERPLILTTPDWTAPEPRRFGVFTLLPPQSKGEVIRMMVPVGEIATRTARAISTARYRRAERKAREAVQRDLDAFRASRSSLPPSK
jgi:hypothetical protein